MSSRLCCVLLLRPLERRPGQASPCSCVTGGAGVARSTAGPSAVLANQATSLGAT